MIFGPPAGSQLAQVGLHGRQQLLVLHIPEVDTGAPRHVGNELPETPMRIATAQLSEYRRWLDRLAVPDPAGPRSESFGAHVVVKER